MWISEKDKIDSNVKIEWKQYNKANEYMGNFSFKIRRWFAEMGQGWGWVDGQKHSEIKPEEWRCKDVCTKTQRRKAAYKLRGVSKEKRRARIGMYSKAMRPTLKAANLKATIEAEETVRPEEFRWMQERERER